MKKISLVLLLIAVTACMIALPASAETIEGWAVDSPAMASIIAYVEAVTDETSENYVPPEARIVLFDSDGTLIGERYPTYSDQCMLVQRLLHDDTAKANSEDAAFAVELEKAYLNHEPLPDSPRSTAQMAAESFAGFTVEEYTAYVREFLKQPVPGFIGMTYGERFFAPMAELVKYLDAHHFQVFICSGTERIFLREMIADTLGECVPPYRVIGSTFSLTATGQGEISDRNYTYAPDDQVLLEGNMIFKNLKMAKVTSIVNEIGMAPIMVFGNSSGDFAMAQYALQHGGKAYMLLCDDTARDYGDEEEAAKFAAYCAALGFETVSMRDEFETIYAEGVRKADASETALLSEYWTDGSEAAADINEYLLAVTDEMSPDYIPVEDRIAVFDLAGTLMCETYPFCFEYMVFADYALNNADSLPEEVIAVAQEITDAAGRAKPSGMSTRQAAAAAVAYKGMTVEELRKIVREFKDSEAWGFTGMTRGEAYYKPMVELLEKLQANGFTVYIVTATERNIVREVIAGMLNIPPSQVIGTEYGYTATNQGDAADADYTFQSSDSIVFDGNYYGENAKTSKVDAIVREIGQQPVLSFGNSSGDLAMAVYTISNNQYRSAAYMVLADDADREYGNAESAAQNAASYLDMGIGVFSMRDDFETIYGDGVAKAD
ncbi:MAG: haloacid dehalogenase-like hydrolase [Clostridia bacterium]|nr:haloacid dehalogenase-like hydrolase [Clostridia bacterium]